VLLALIDPGGGDGKLDFVRKYDVDAAGKTHYWMGIVGI
jgi:hypothetical protein